ncbi:TraB/GumN family protein [Arenimonas sp.]|uniref:TraB/GumN family protein n=1 Tax=Arenimonas sp. TaxID=1872635 RepID=UPI0035AF87CE
MSLSLPALLLAAALASPSVGDADAAVDATGAAAGTDSAAPMLDAVVVTGTYPAPGLWEFTREGKTLLVMGTLSPAPRRMVWSSERVESRIAGADLILGPPGVSVSADVGFFGGAMLWPAWRRSKRNPDGQTLEEVLSPDVFARWAAFKQRHLAGNRKVDKLRPLHAARELFDAAVRDAGMTDKSLVDPVVKRVAKANDIPIQSTSLRLTIEDPKETLRQFNAIELGDEQCLVQTMDRLQDDLSTMVVRANAWANGELDVLRALPYVDQKRACRRAMASNEIARQQGIVDLDAQVQAKWLESVRSALAAHDVVFATLPVARLLDDDGVTAALQAEGFTVRAPDQ